MQAYLNRIHRYNPVYNAIVSMVDDDELLRQAGDADRALARGEYRGWMHGMPHAVKDLSAVEGIRYTSGSPLFADRIADSDSNLAARLRAAGAIFIGNSSGLQQGLPRLFRFLLLIPNDCSQRVCRQILPTLLRANCLKLFDKEV